ncbi:MAG: hypothetical protein AAFU85_04155 [Planctomycetota bacterium]
MRKSSLLQQMIIRDMQAGHGVGVVCPHGGLAQAVLAAVPMHRTDDVVLLDAIDRSHSPALCVHRGGWIT